MFYLLFDQYGLWSSVKLEEWDNAYEYASRLYSNSSSNSSSRNGTAAAAAAAATIPKIGSYESIIDQLLLRQFAIQAFLRNEKTSIEEALCLYDPRMEDDNNSDNDPMILNMLLKGLLQCEMYDTFRTLFNDQLLHHWYLVQQEKESDTNNDSSNNSLLPLPPLSSFMNDETLTLGLHCCANVGDITFMDEICKLKKKQMKQKDEDPFSFFHLTIRY